MDEFDELDIELQDADDIGSRLILLSALVLWPDLSSGDEGGQWLTWLDRQGVLAVASGYEVNLLKSRTRDEEEASARSAEAMLPLAWSVGLLSQPPARSDADSLQSLLDGLPVPPERVEPFLNGLILLDEDDIAVERERAEVWNWRLGAEIQRRATQGLVLEEIEDAIQEVVLEAASTMIIAENDGSDLLIDGVPIRDLDGDLLDWMLVVTEERLRALNWVCGLTEWDQIDISD